ncbi:MAG: hypothetical protein QNK35_17155, partial [Bacteroides sp.]|nr:hypothetical protein [Bacteroides sp.]
MNWKLPELNRFFMLTAFLLTIGQQGYGQVELAYEQNETVSWEEAIRMYEWMDEHYAEATLVEMGISD